MNKYRKYLGLVVDNMIITGIEKYYDFSTDKVECAFILEGSHGGVNCDLFINKYFG